MLDRAALSWSVCRYKAGCLNRAAYRVHRVKTDARRIRSRQVDVVGIGRTRRATERAIRLAGITAARAAPHGIKAALGDEVERQDA
jgi:hypothetical protein